ncbi:GIY-YIG nuclease family protein [Oceanospirillum sediminis]|uniref:GIY-YIG nuclease family protein n=1 Tax=Oceanospirillum sediminis TaxID=2760088 RepID=A0A839INF5_9GAMM|nr:GIY-YIG nuclease family protein [Oceanospirillum sediminis]
MTVEKAEYDLSDTELTTLSGNIPAQKGSYVIAFYLPEEQIIRVGRLGEYLFQPGFFLYTGSAKGSGGLKSRLKHHMSCQNKCHWHLDYLRPEMQLVGIWYTTNTGVFEHAWADILSQWKGVQAPVTGLGASDCKCHTHFFHFRRLPAIRTFRQKNRQLIVEPPDIKEVRRTQQPFPVLPAKLRSGLQR